MASIWFKMVSSNRQNLYSKDVYIDLYIIYQMITGWIELSRRKVYLKLFYNQLVEILIQNQLYTYLFLHHKKLAIIIIKYNNLNQIIMNIINITFQRNLNKHQNSLIAILMKKNKNKINKIIIKKSNKINKISKINLIKINKTK